VYPEQVVGASEVGQAWVFSSYQLSITIDAVLVGQILQFGFSSLATNYNSSAVFYDNTALRQKIPVGACCDEGCSEETADSCSQSGGEYQGDATGFRASGAIGPGVRAQPTGKLEIAP
jgi:hypothetical protein